MAQIKTDLERKKEQRERTAKSRAKKKEQAVIAAAADEECRFEEFNAWRRTERLTFPGEIEAFENAENCVDALLVAREFLLALGQPDIQAGECLLDIERRVCFAWATAGAPLLNRNTIQLDLSVADTTGVYLYDFDQKWIPLEGADLPIDISKLPTIVVPAVPVSLPVEVSAAVTPAVVDFPSVEEEDTVTPTIEAAIIKAHRREERASSID